MRADIQTNVFIEDITHGTEVGEIAKAAAYWGYRLIVAPVEPDDGGGRRQARLILDEPMPVEQELIRLLIIHTITTGQSINASLEGLAREVRIEAQGWDFDSPIADQPGIGEGSGPLPR